MVAEKLTPRNGVGWVFFGAPHDEKYILLIVGYCFRDSKQAEKIWQRARKDAAKMPFLYIRCLSTGHLKKHLIVALKACERGRR